MFQNVERERAVRAMLVEHSTRDHLYKAGIFQDYGWTILLGTYLASLRGVEISEASIQKSCDLPLIEVQRALYFLSREGHVAPRAAGDEVVLTDIAMSTMQTYLDQVATLTARRRTQN